MADALEVASEVASEEVAEAPSKFGCYEDEKSNGDSTTPLADRHFDLPVREDRYRSTSVVDTEVIVAVLFCGGLTVIGGKKYIGIRTKL